VHLSIELRQVVAASAVPIGHSRPGEVGTAPASADPAGHVGDQHAGGVDIGRDESRQERRLVLAIQPGTQTAVERRRDVGRNREWCRRRRWLGRCRLGIGGHRTSVIDRR
jgi:hypothetical protein